MGRRATVEDILKGGERDLPIPGLIGDDGEPLTIRVRKVHAGERMALLPGVPTMVLEGPQEGIQDRERSWLASLSAEALAERRLAASNFCYRLIALAALDPILTVEAAQRLGDSALVLTREILAFSANASDAAAAAAAPELGAAGG